MMMGVACVAFALLALLRPRRTAAYCGVSVPTLMVMAVRDLASALALIASPRPHIPLVARIMIDTGDTLLLARTRPKVAAMAGVFAAWASLTLAAAARTDTSDGA